MASSLQRFDVFISHEDALKRDVVIDELICKLRPSWPRADIIYERMEGGVLNLMLCYHLRADAEKDDAIIVRISSRRLREQGCFRQNEFMLMQMCSQAGIFTDILGSFANGMIYKYIKGSVMDVCGTEFYQEEYMRTMCRSLAKLHLIKPEDCELVDLDGNPVKYPQDMTIENLLSNLLSNGPHTADIESGLSFQMCGVSLEEVNEEMDWIKSHVAGLGLSRCIAHNDLWAPNIIYVDQTDSFKIIDYEFATYGYECGDLTGLCGTTQDLFAMFGILPPGAPPVTDELVRSWQKIYLEEKYTLQGRDLCDITEDVLEHFHVECAICSTVTYLFWFVELYGGIDFSQKEIPLSIDKKMRPFMDIYKSRRQELPPLIEKYQQMKKPE